MRSKFVKISRSGLALILIPTLLLAGCGGDAQQQTSTLSGVAAVGSPIANGIIKIYCVSGDALNSITSSTGGWQVTLTGQTLPCAVQVGGGTINGAANNTNYHSIATSIGVSNVTPLTDLVVANLVGTATPAIWFDGLNTSSTPLVNISEANVNTSIARMHTALSGLPLNTNNPITMNLAATPGTVGYNMLVALGSAIANTPGVTYSSLLSNASSASFSAPNQSFVSALTAAYVGMSGGSGSTAPPPNMPSAPNGVTAAALSGTQINLSWLAVSDASGYNVWKDGVQVNTTLITSTSYVMTVAAYPSPTFTVTAVNSSGESVFSTAVQSPQLICTSIKLLAEMPIDGLNNITKWGQATCELASLTYLSLRHTANYLYVFVDSVSDITDDTGYRTWSAGVWNAINPDYLGIAIDIDNNRQYSPGIDLQYGVCTYAGQPALAYYPPSFTSTPLPSPIPEGFVAIDPLYLSGVKVVDLNGANNGCDSQPGGNTGFFLGFGVTLQSSIPHRFYEARIPIANLQLGSNATAHIAISANSYPGPRYALAIPLP
jgi:hypothetical protein